MSSPNTIVLILYRFVDPHLWNTFLASCVNVLTVQVEEVSYTTQLWIHELNGCSKCFNSRFVPTVLRSVMMVIMRAVSMCVKYIYPCYSHSVHDCVCPEEVFPQSGCSLTQSNGVIIPLLLRANITSHCSRVPPSNPLKNTAPSALNGCLFHRSLLNVWVTTVIGGWPSESVNNIMKTSFTRWPWGLCESEKTLNTFCCSFHCQREFLSCVDVFILVNSALWRWIQKACCWRHAMTQGS